MSDTCPNSKRGYALAGYFRIVLGGSFDVFIAVGSADPSGDYETGRRAVEIG